jgi:hypothetical protein
MIKKYFGSPEGLLIFGLVFINAVTATTFIIMAGG